MNYWLHRITGGDNAIPLSEELFKKGYISIGWSDFSDEADLNTIRSGWTPFETLFAKWKPMPRNRYNLWRFVNEMKPGDIVVVPFSYTFAVCEIADDVVYTNETIDPELLVDWNGNRVSKDEKGYLRYDEKTYVDLGFYRKIKFTVKERIPRAEYADQALFSRLKIRQTNADISDLKDSIEEAIRRFQAKKPIYLKASIVEETWKTVLQNIRKLQNDMKFEQLVEWYLKSIGGTGIYTPAKNESSTEDGDADRVAFFEKIGVAIMVQAKKHTDQTDSWAVDQIKLFKDNHVFDRYKTILWVISTCDSFSEEALNLAEENQVRLINGEEFAKMIIEVGLDGLTL